MTSLKFRFSMSQKMNFWKLRYEQRILCLTVSLCRSNFRVSGIHLGAHFTGVHALDHRTPTI